MGELRRRSSESSAPPRGMEDGAMTNRWKALSEVAAATMLSFAFSACLSHDSATDPVSAPVFDPADHAEPAVPRAIQVILVWRAGKQDVLRIVGQHEVTDDADLESALRKEKAAHATDAEPPTVLIDARGEVPWKDVVAVINTLK